MKRREVYYSFLTYKFETCKLSYCIIDWDDDYDKKLPSFEAFLIRYVVYLLEEVTYHTSTALSCVATKSNFFQQIYYVKMSMESSPHVDVLLSNHHSIVLEMLQKMASFHRRRHPNHYYS